MKITPTSSHPGLRTAAFKNKEKKTVCVSDWLHLKRWDICPSVYSLSAFSLDKPPTKLGLTTSLYKLWVCVCVHAFLLQPRRFCDLSPSNLSLFSVCTVKHHPIYSCPPPPSPVSSFCTNTDDWWRFEETWERNGAGSRVLSQDVACMCVCVCVCVCAIQGKGSGRELTIEALNVYQGTPGGLSWASTLLWLAQADFLWVSEPVIGLKKDRNGARNVHEMEMRHWPYQGFRRRFHMREVGGG